MIRTVTDWRDAWSAAGLPAEAVPAYPDLGVRYPWRALAYHAVSRDHLRRVELARQRIAEAVTTYKRPDGAPAIWRLGWSAGKDSTALACLLSEMGLGAAAPAFGEKDDLDYPAEDLYLSRIAAQLGLPEPEVLRPEVQLLDWLAAERVSLVEDLHGRAAELSRDHFYGLLDRHREASGYNAVILGLRAAESHARSMNRARHGWIYTRQDGLTVASPLADWQDMDVHAYVASRGVPLMPLYQCIDPGMDAMRLRKSWWVAGGGAARYGHYVWLRRWWPGQWARAVQIDPQVAMIS